MWYPRARAAWALTGAGILIASLSLAVSMSAESGLPPVAAAQAGGFPSAADVDTFRKNIEPVFMRDRGGTDPGGQARFL